MYSALVPFENIVDAVKDSTGIQNLRNLYPKIRRLVYRAEKEIGFGGALVLKKIVYSTSDNTIVNNKAKLPDDLMYIESVGMCKEGLCPKDYKLQGNWMFLCRPIEKFTLIYYTLLCDGEGNPIITENHFEAVVAGLTYFMYAPKIFNNEGSMSVYKELQKYYDDRIGEARGDDVFPTTPEEWSQIAQTLKMSYRDILIYSPEKKCFCCIDQSENEQVISIDGPGTDTLSYHWQYDDFEFDINDAPDIDIPFLETKNIVPINDFISGQTLSLSNIGRIGIAIRNIDENDYKIMDVFNFDITSIVFDSYYNAELRTQIYISKEYYSNGEVYFKLTEN